MASVITSLTQSTIDNTETTNEQDLTTTLLLQPGLCFIQAAQAAPFDAIRHLFDYLRTNPSSATALDAIYSTLGISKTTASRNPLSDQRIRVDLSPKRAHAIPSALRSELSPHGQEEILSFFDNVFEAHFPEIISALSAISGRDFASLHQRGNINLRIFDYTPKTAAPKSSNGYRAHTDYGTFSIMFQDEHEGLEIEAPDAPGTCCCAH